MNSIRKKTKTILANLFEEMFMKEGKNISHWRQRNALEETGRYVEKYLPKVLSFSNRYALFDLIVAEVKGKTGLICEFGVAGGRSINYLAGKMPDRILYGFDSFEGLPEDWRDGMPRGAYRQAKLPHVASNVRLIKGLFDVSLPTFLDEQKENALMLKKYGLAEILEEKDLNEDTFFSIVQKVLGHLQDYKLKDREAVKLVNLNAAEIIADETFKLTQRTNK